MSFVRNIWYVGAIANEIGKEPLARTLLDTPVVFFRTDDGQVVSMLDACPHRAVPLHFGKVVGDRIRCAYHGLEFDSGGVCRHNPHIAGGRPEGLKARVFPNRQRYGMVWIWLGDPALAEETPLPDYAPFEDSENFVWGLGSTWVDADYRLLIDNLFDLSHAEYLHPTSVGVVGSNEVVKYDLEMEPERVKVFYNLPDVLPPVVWHAAWTASERIDQYSSMEWRGGGNCFLDLTVTPAGSPPSEGWSLPFVNFLTPETSETTHYFWVFARNFMLEDEALTEAIGAVSKQAFEGEDRPILEAAQKRLKQTGLPLRNFSVGDRASAYIRRALDRESKAEEAGTVAEAKTEPRAADAPA